MMVVKWKRSLLMESKRVPLENLLVPMVVKWCHQQREINLCHKGARFCCSRMMLNIATMLQNHSLIKLDRLDVSPILVSKFCFC